MPDKPKSLSELIDNTITDTLSGCTSCARCYDVCPMPRYSKALDGADGRVVVGGVLGLLRRQPTNPQSLEWVRTCVMSTSCVPACPEGVNPMLMLRVARMVALGSLGGEKQLNSREEPNFFRKIDTFSALELDDRELNEWHDRRLP